MKHGIHTRKFGRDSKHRRAMLRNLATNLITHDIIRTTLHRAKDLKKITEKLIGHSFNPNRYNARKKLQGYLFTRFAYKRAFHEFPHRFKDRTGGYVRIIPDDRRRKGDGAKMAWIELLDLDKIPERNPITKRMVIEQRVQEAQNIALLAKRIGQKLIITNTQPDTSSLTLQPTFNSKDIN
ncbi:hypothetical protein AKO1_015273 [Acrasis kona]|uniref:50S ribosomal protein L17, chloroplastic n=1 Tax=Acrasis kona TaxID=1008807 RepID=A0AAW2ZGL4_9EUKA